MKPTAVWLIIVPCDAPFRVQFAARLLRIVFLLTAIFLSPIIFSQQLSYSADTLILKERFDKELDNRQWIIEKSASPGDKAVVQEGKLLLDTYGGVTAWLAQELQGNYLIRFKRKIIMTGAQNDRLSDCNQFWMATDPFSDKLFYRKGGFSEYDSLRMYYVGMGGNYNSTTRFRRYDGKGEKMIIGEFTDSLHLLQPNKEYLFEIICKEGHILFKVDGEIYFTYKDPQPLTHGWFAFRSTRSRQEIDDLEIWRIK